MSGGINSEELVGKTVGHRQPADPLRIQPGRIAASREWSDHGFFPRFPKGVVRFASHEEADQWLLTHQLRRQ